MTTQVTLNLKLDSLNEAFQNGHHTRELQRILRLLADAVASGQEGRFHLYDANGNCVGAAMLEVWEN